MVCIQIKAVAAGLEIPAVAAKVIALVDLRSSELLNLQRESCGVVIGSISDILCGHNIRIVGCSDLLAINGFHALSVLRERCHHVLHGLSLFLDINGKACHIIIVFKSEKRGFFV